MHPWEAKNGLKACLLSHTAEPRSDLHRWTVGTTKTKKESVVQK